MPIPHGELATRGPRIVIHGSAAVEIEWALSAAEQPEFRQDHPDLAELYRDEPGFVERVRDFWGDHHPESAAGFLELLVLAHHGGLLLSLDGDALVEHLEDLCLEAPAAGSFPSETEQDQAVLQRRLAVLRRSSVTRDRYVELIGDVWHRVRPMLERSGRVAIDGGIAARRDRLAEGASWGEVAENECRYGALLTRLVSELDEAGTLAVIPAFFTHRGLLFAMPGMVIVGVRTELSGAQARARTELIARRLRTIADPTRLAIIGALSSAPRTVTELSRLFDLAQPTVSNHVKVLREAGLVSKVRHGSRQDLAADLGAVTELLEHLQSVLGLPLAG